MGGSANFQRSQTLVLSQIRLPFATRIVLETRKMRPGRSTAHPNEFWNTFLIKLLIRNDYPQHPCPNQKMRPGRPKAHQNEFWDTFPIKLLIRNDNPQHPCQKPEKWGPEGPRLNKMSFGDTFLITLLIRNDNLQHLCQHPKMRPGGPKAHQNKF